MTPPRCSRRGCAASARDPRCRYCATHCKPGEPCKPQVKKVCPHPKDGREIYDDGRQECRRCGAQLIEDVTARHDE